VTTERFEEIVSRYADGAATPEEMGELERLMKGDPALRRSFVERMRLEVGLSTLSEASSEAANGRPPSRRSARGRSSAMAPAKRRGVGRRRRSSSPQSCSRCCAADVPLDGPCTSLSPRSR
jgi:anti-sigma factor RsiW